MVHGSDLSEAEQEILELLWQHQHEAVPLPKEAVRDCASLGLQGKGWVEADGVSLTASGLEVARRAIRRHRLAERLLADLMGHEREGAEEDACRLEHSLMEGLDERVCTFLGHPRVCPHGHTIPEGECCRRASHSVGPAVAGLGELRPGEEGTIAYLATPQGGDLQKFLAMGIHPGDPVTLVRKIPTIVFRCGHSQFAVDRALASQVFVRRRGD